MKRNFILLAGLTALAFLAVLQLAPDNESTGRVAQKHLLLPDIAAKINDVDRVDIIAAGNVTVATLHKTDTQWQLQQMDNYRANWDQLKTLLAGLASAKVIETKTDKPAYYARLGVEDIDAEDAASVLVRLSIADQHKAIIIGHRAQGTDGQYLRIKGQAASVLVDKTLEAPAEALAWVDKRIIDIKPSEVTEVELIHPGGDRVLVTKVSADDTDFTLADLPAGREIKSQWAVNSLGSVLSLLDLESARPDTGIDWNGAVRMRMLLFSGVEIMAEMLESDGSYLVKLHASHPAADIVDKQDVATEKASVKPTDGEVTQADNVPDKVAEKAADEVNKRVADINQRVTGWAYAISKYKFEAMVKKTQDMLKPLESP